MVEWSCTKNGISKRGPYVLVDWSCANERNKLIRTLTFGRVVAHKEKHETEPSFRCCCFPQGSNKYLLFNSDIEKFKLKINGGRDKRSYFFSFYLFFILFYFIIFLFIYSSIFLFFVFWSGVEQKILIKAGWNSTFLFLVSFFSLLVSIKGMRTRDGFKIIFCEPRGGKILLRSSTSFKKL